MSVTITEATDIRHLPLPHRSKLAEILDLNNVWKKLAEVIPHPEKDEEALYNSGHLSIFESSCRRGGSPSSKLLSDWETRGRHVRPTVKVLLDCLVKAQLYQAADYVACDILKGKPPPRPDYGRPARILEIDDDDFDPVYVPRPMPSSTGDRSLSSSPSIIRDPDVEGDGDVDIPMPTPPEEEPVATDTDDHSNNGMTDVEGVAHYNFAFLWKITNGFAKRLGKGAFGEVYWGRLSCDGALQEVAVKKLSFSARDQFMTELRVMARYRHQNLLPVLGYSINNPKVCCLITAYMANGCLQDRLELKNGSQPLNWTTRLSIAIGTAKGLAHLHNFQKEPLVHRDVKSANILLDSNLEAKVGDFGIARIGAQWQETTRMVTKRISGTCAYMSKEAFQGNVTVKMDTFSYGIVLLELLTGLPPDDPRRENRNLLAHVKEEEQNAPDWADKKAGDWPVSSITQFYNLAMKCTKGKMKKRLLIEEALEELEDNYRKHA